MLCTPKTMEISELKSSNINEVIDLFKRVFSDSEGESEGEMIGQLVGDLLTDKSRLISYIVTKNDEIIACICLSELLLSSKESAFLLSPVAVTTKEQGKGLGQRLINHAINQLKLSGLDFIFTYGDPDFYSRVGFEAIDEASVHAPFSLSYAHGWLAQSLNGKNIQLLSCKTQCVKALNKKEYW